MNRDGAHPKDRYCGNQMCCWGPAGKLVPKRYRSVVPPLLVESWGQFYQRTAATVVKEELEEED